MADVRPWGHNDLTIGALMEHRAAEDGGFVFARADERTITISELAEAANRFANALATLGIRQGDRITVMLPTHSDHVVVFFGLLKLCVCMVPVNVNLRGDGLNYVLSHSQAKVMIVDGRYAEQVDPLLPGLGLPTVIWRERRG